MLVEIKRISKIETTVVSSLDVAETFGKRHDNVLKDIRELDCSDEFRLLNFEESTYLNSQNKKQPMYYMTRDGFAILVMGYNGEKAMRFKEAYIKQFNAMEKALRGKLIEREKGIEIDKITVAVKKKGVKCLGGKESSAYKNKTLRGKVYHDIYRELKRQFGISTYKAIKRNQCDLAVEAIEHYELPYILKEQIQDSNAQMNMEGVK